MLDLQVPETSPWFGKTVTVKELRWYNSMAVLFLEGVEDRTAADTLVRAILLVNTDPTELPSEEDAWYDHQLVGLKVQRDGVEIGQIVRVDHLPSQDLLVVKIDDREVFVPFVKVIVPVVDVKAGFVVVTPPPSLIEELTEGE